MGIEFQPFIVLVQNPRSLSLAVKKRRVALVRSSRFLFVLVTPPGDRPPTDRKPARRFNPEETVRQSDGADKVWMAGRLRSGLLPYGPRILRSAGRPGPSSEKCLSFRLCGRHRDHSARTETVSTLITGLPSSFLLDFNSGTVDRECLIFICDHGCWTGALLYAILAPYHIVSTPIFIIFMSGGTNTTTEKYHMRRYLLFSRKNGKLKKPDAMG
ncbi:uncharacterized protein LOC124708283 isoform X2 [Lolium rigidum]|uniref:uncharacterized protein LOC124708283 isoform X2 n=1 Tax=Lolium rigidum TaxID=89674 RepID=UPI001F5D6B7A|nr:uncharacterized protein LOC124708283 isoform X2 [Lolium rigidum]